MAPGRGGGSGVGLLSVESRDKTPRTLLENLAPLPLLPIASLSSCWVPSPRLVLPKELLLALMVAVLSTFLSFSGGQNTK